MNLCIQHPPRLGHTGRISEVDSSAEGARPAPGYTRTTKVLHWLTFGLLAAQFAVGYLLDIGDRGRGRGRGRSGGSGRGRGRGGDTEALDLLGDDVLLTAHVVLGVTILVLTLARVVWRRRVGLPPWATGLSMLERSVAHWTERVLYVLLFVIPASGLSLIFVSDDLVALHVTSHIVFYLAFALHVGLVLKHQFINRDGLLRRML